MSRHVVGLSRAIHIVSSMWVFILALLILSDVFGRIIFLSPIPGTKEILQNSVIMVTFLQLPLAIFSGSMLRTTLFLDVASPGIKKLMQSLCYILGFLLFVAVGWATIPEAFEALRLNEYEGEGALRIYTWPIRFLICGTAFFAAFAYLFMLIAEWRGSLGPTDQLAN